MSKQIAKGETPLLATIAAIFLIASQIAGKATRDALFLSNYAVTSLPLIIIAAAFVSIGSVFLIARLLQKKGPARVIPIAFTCSIVLLLGEWWLTLYHPPVAAVVFYLHAAVFGSILISGFWSIVNERFDPRTGKRAISRIATGATLGGLLGGLLAERVAADFSVSSMLPLLAVTHLITLVLVLLFIRNQESEPTPNDKVEETLYESSVKILSQQSYLQSLAFLVLTATTGAALIDYVFKAAASEAFKEGDALLRFFALYYMVSGFLTVVLQWTLSRIALQKLGTVNTARLLPGTITLGALVNLFFPALATSTLVRGAEGIVRNSLYRSAYEVLYTPVPPAEKRPTKTLIDVGIDRIGDAVGGGLIRLILVLGPILAQPVMLGMAAVLGGVGLYIGQRLHRGYIRSLEKSLRNRAIQLDLDEVEDRTTRQTLLQTMAGTDLDPLHSYVSRRSQEDSGEASSDDASRDSRETEEVEDLSLRDDPVLRQLQTLQSGNATAIKRLLEEVREDNEIDPLLVPQLIQLLAWDEVTRRIIKVLRGHASRISGQLTDALLDPDQEFSIRRRLPRALAGSPDERTARGLLQGMEDPRFEVRYQCGKALSTITRQNSQIELPRDTVLALVQKEVAVDRRVWESHRLLDRFEQTEEESAVTSFVDDYVKDRANRSLQHVFTLLSLVLPTEPLKIAYRGLQTDDPSLRGTALEYLESVLPEKIRESLWPFLEGDYKHEGSDRSREEILEDLMRSNQSIQLNLEELRRAEEDADSGDETS